MTGAVVPLRLQATKEPFRLTPPPSDLPPDVVARALHQVQHATPEMLAAVEKLAEELDLLGVGRPTPGGVWHVMVHTLIARLGEPS